MDLPVAAAARDKRDFGLASMVERRRVHFSGHVQGVGFRYTARSIARRYRVAGYVQNLSDGRVVVEAEGEAAELDRYLGDLAGQMAAHIRSTETERGAASGEFSGFDIRF